MKIFNLLDADTDGYISKDKANINSLNYKTLEIISEALI
jgi:hypothetical protein